MGIFKAIRNFFKGGDKMQQENNFYNQDTLLTLYNQYLMSEAFEWYQIGDRYYKAENDILYRQMYSVKDGVEVPDYKQPNNHLNHNYAKCLVDQKVDYSLGKPPKITCDDEIYLNELTNILKKNKFNYKLNILGKKASNNGISWLHPYVDAQGDFKFIIVPAKQVIPIWNDDMETELEAAIRVYDTVNTLNQSVEENTVLEYWSKTGVKRYTIQGNSILPLNEENYDLLNQVDGTYSEEQPHFLQNGGAKSWGIVPFIPFKNNLDLFPDVRYVKNLIDNYDLTRSDLGNALEQLRNFILVLKNAQGTELEEILTNLKLYGIIKTDNIDGTGSDVDMLSNPIDATASTIHSGLLKQNIIELLQGVNLNLDFNVPPSGVALQLLYSALDIKANAFEAEIRQGFDLLQDFINIYLGESNKIKNNAIADIEFIRNLPQNTSEQIQQARNSQGVISNKTIFKHHPFVSDPEKEEQQFKQENQYDNHFDKVPF